MKKARSSESPRRKLRAVPSSADTPPCWFFRPDRDWRFHPGIFLYEIGRVLTRLLCRLVFRWEIRGRENIPPTGPLIIAPNHISYLDPPVVGAAADWSPAFMAKADLFRIPVFGWLISRTRAFPVQRGRADRRAMRWALDLLSRGEMVLIFPEGTRSLTGKLLEAEPGITHIILRSRAPVLPVAVAGTDKIFRQIKPFPRFNRIRVSFGKPLTFEKYYGRSVKEVHACIGGQIMEKIQEMLDAMRR